MFRTLAITLIISSASAANAQDCVGLGLKNAYLTDHFCSQLRDLVPTEKTRGTPIEGDLKPGQPDLSQWADVQVLQDAYRADPRKTLELIKRIKSAGGLQDN